MKHLVILIALCPLLSFCQEKRDNVITVSSGDTTNLYDKVVSLLETEGFKLSKYSNKTTGLVSTEYKSLGRYRNTICYYNFDISGNAITMRGYWLYDNMLHKAAYKDSFEAAWEEMDKIAKQLGNVTYAKEKNRAR